MINADFVIRLFVAVTLACIIYRVDKAIRK